MLGGILGDTIGSIYEFDEAVSKKINIQKRREILVKPHLLSSTNFITDDTILTVAIADAVINKKDYEEKLKEYSFKYNKISNREHAFKNPFSPNYIKWLNGEIEGKSFGNGSAMRVSPIAYLFNDLQVIQDEARKSALPSHNTTEGIKGAQAIASAIYLARIGKSKLEINEYITDTYKYDLKLNLENLQETNIFNSTCAVTVPQAIYIFLISNDFEDSIRKAISIGGDTDTIACIVGSISEAYYGISNHLKDKIWCYLPDEFIKIIKEAYKRIEDVL